MKEKKMNRTMFLSIVLGVALVLCASPIKAETKATGSDSTIEVVKALVAEFEKATGTKITVAGGGSSAGAKACIEGTADIAFLSRDLKEDEVKAGLVEASYAIDGVAVIVNKNNPVENITLEELQKLFTGQMETWSDGKQVLLFNRNESSGTRECFDVKVMRKQPFSPKAQIKHDAVLFDSIAKIPTAVGYTSACHIKEGLKVLKVNGVLPNAETLANKTYPICRTLSFATKGAAAGDAKSLIDFATSDKGREVIQKAGYVPFEKAAAKDTTQAAK